LTRKKKREGGFFGVGGGKTRGKKENIVQTRSSVEITRKRPPSKRQHKGREKWKRKGGGGEGRNWSAVHLRMWSKKKRK